MTTTGELVPSRLNELGQRMKKDIWECYNGALESLISTVGAFDSCVALDAMKKQSLIGKFCKAHAWNERLAAWKYEFKQLKKDLHLALTFNTALVIHDMSDRWVIRCFSIVYSLIVSFTVAFRITECVFYYTAGCNIHSLANCLQDTPICRGIRKVQDSAGAQN